MDKKQILCISFLVMYIILAAGGVYYVRQDNMMKDEAVKIAIQCNYNKPLSRRGTIDMLLAKGYERKHITYVLDNVKIDWSENAAKRASTFCKGHTKRYIYDQLVKEKFAENEIQYAIKFCEGKVNSRPKDLKFKLC